MCDLILLYNSNSTDWNKLINLDNGLNIGVLGVGLTLTVLFILFYFFITKSRPLLTSLPGVWTSLGLLGTFVTICNSLQNLENNTGNQGLDIIKIIEELIPAFSTSIIGLLGALFVTIITKNNICSRRQERR